MKYVEITSKNQAHARNTWKSSRRNSITKGSHCTYSNVHIYISRVRETTTSRKKHHQISNTKLLALSAAGLSHWSFNRHFRKRRSLRATMPEQLEDGTVMYCICRTSFTTCLDILTFMMQILSPISTESIAPGSQIKKKQEKAKWTEVTYSLGSKWMLAHHKLFTIPLSVWAVCDLLGLDEEPLRQPCHGYSSNSVTGRSDCFPCCPSSAGGFNLKSFEFPVAAVGKQNSHLPNTVKCFQSKHVWLVIQFEIPSVKLIEIGMVSLTDFP